MQSQKGFSSYSPEEIYAVYLAAAKASPYPVASLWSENDFIHSLSKNTVYLAHEEQKVAAFMLLQELDHELEILLLAADPAFWGKGAIDCIWREQILTKPSETRVFLDVHEKNLPAIRLYERLGFTQTHRRNNYYAGGEAAILYQFQILT